MIMHLTQKAVKGKISTWQTKKKAAQKLATGFCLCC